MGKFTFLKALFSPFKPFKLKWYIGKIAIGTPYFFPRRWVKDKDKPGYLKAVPKKIGFDFVSLGWKIKWSDDDYRFEWPPIWSFVFFKWQIAVSFEAPEEHHYWEAWLFYHYETPKYMPVEYRLIKCMEKFPLIWSVYEGDKKTVVNYYKLILKKKYLKLLTPQKQL